MQNKQKNPTTNNKKTQKATTSEQSVDVPCWCGSVEFFCVLCKNRDTTMIKLLV